MATRSTRGKIRWQCQRAIENLDRAMQNLAQLDGMANDNSPYINKNMPEIVIMIDGCKKIVQQFHDGL